MANDKNETKHVIVGLGGVGGDVIKAYRQQIIDKYGELDKADVTKNIQFLYVDSKQDEFDEDKWLYQGKTIKLTGDSNYLMQAGLLAERISDFSTRPAFVGDEASWGDILKDKDLATKAGNQMRKLGRVNLIPNLNNIVEIIKGMIRNLQNNSSSLVTTHIVTGLAGGTGSGSIVDITHQLIKSLETDRIESKILLYLKVPELSSPKDKQGTYAGATGSTTFYQLNGYAALKELNSLSNGYFVPYDITTKKARNVTTNFFKSAYIFTEKNNKKQNIADVVPSMASVIYLKTITSQANTTVTSDSTSDKKITLAELEGYIDGENFTLNPAAWWQLAAKFPVAGVYKVGIPKVQIRESFAHLLVLQAFNKLLYNNYDLNGGEGFQGKKEENGNLAKEKNQIITNLRSALMDEWFLDFDRLILDEPMIDKNNIFITEGANDYSFKTAFAKQYTKQYQLVYQNSLHNGKSITEKERLKSLKMVINDYFNKDFKQIGYERYYNGMTGKAQQLAEFVAKRIKDKMFGKTNGNTRYFPMDSYIELLAFIYQDYFDEIEKKLKIRQNEYTKIVASKSEELKTIEQEYIDSFGFFGSSKKRESAVKNFQDALNKFWYHTIALNGISFAIQFVHSHLKNQLLDVQTEIKNEVRSLTSRQQSLNKEYIDEMEKVKSKKGVNGFASISNDEGIERFKNALLKNKEIYFPVIDKLEKLIFENKDKVLKKVEDLTNKKLPIMQAAYNEVDSLLKNDNFRILLNEEDRIYNAHIIDVLFDVYNKDASSTEMKDFLTEIKNMSAPMAMMTKPENTTVPTKHDTIIVLPRLKEVQEGNEERIEFYKELKKSIALNFNGAKIVEIDDEGYKNEITFSQFSYQVTLDKIDNIHSLKTIYDKAKNNQEFNFLMHIEDVGNLSELVPPKSMLDFKTLLFPSLVVISLVDGFEKYGDENYWKLSQKINFKPQIANDQEPSEFEGDKIDIKFCSNSLEQFWNIKDDILENENVSDVITTFINPFILNSVNKKAKEYCKDTAVAKSIIEKYDNMLEQILIEGKNDRKDEKFVRYKEMRKKIIELTNYNN